MKSSKNRACNFRLCFYCLRYLIYHILASFEIGTENVKTVIKQKHFFKNLRQGFFISSVKCTPILKELHQRLFKLVFVHYTLNRTLLEGAYYLVLSLFKVGKSQSIYNHCLDT